MKFEDRKFQDGDPVIWNSYQNCGGPAIPGKDQNAVILSIYSSVGKGRDGDYAYNIEVGRGKNTVWGYQLRHAMFKYDPKQAGDTDEDI